MRAARVILPLFIFLAAACAGEQADKSAAPRVVMQTDAGAIVLELYPDKAPITVANFLRYVDAGAFKGAVFYRATRPDNDPMITVIQGGLWEPKRHGEEGYVFKPPFPPIAHETTQVSGLSHTDGVISMARDEPGTASSEFFISVGDNTSLDFGGARNPDGQGFAAFGRVVQGMDVVRAIDAAPTGNGEGFEGQLLVNPVRILSVTREGKGR